MILEQSTSGHHADHRQRLLHPQDRQDRHCLRLPEAVDVQNHRGRPRCVRLLPWQAIHWQ